MSVEQLEAERLAARRRYLRPIVVATAFSWVAELWLLLFYGVYLSDEGSLLYKIIWTLGFCGLGMGLALGALIDVLLVDRVSPRRAVWSTAALSFATLGVACNLLCMFLDPVGSGGWGCRPRSAVGRRPELVG